MLLVSVLIATCFSLTYSTTNTNRPALSFSSKFVDPLDRNGISNQVSVKLKPSNAKPYRERAVGSSQMAAEKMIKSQVKIFTSENEIRNAMKTVRDIFDHFQIPVEFKQEFEEMSDEMSTIFSADFMLQNQVFKLIAVKSKLMDMINLLSAHESRESVSAIHILQNSIRKLDKMRLLIEQQ